MAKASRPSTVGQGRQKASKSGKRSGRVQKKATARSRGARYSPEFKRKCLELLPAGMTLEAVAGEKGVSTVSLSRWKKEAKQDGSYLDEPSRC